MPPFVGQTKLILLPKVPNPSHAKDFRPISCCTIIYKCIAKLLCSRLNEVLPHLVQQPQEAFVKRRELLFNVCIWLDIVRGYTRKGISPRCIMTIDLYRAFDLLHCGFIQDLLHHFKFPHQFMKWIMACITSISYTMHINGF